MRTAGAAPRMPSSGAPGGSAIYSPAGFLGGQPSVRLEFGGPRLSFGSTPQPAALHPQPAALNVGGRVIEGVITTDPING